MPSHRSWTRRARALGALVLAGGSVACASSSPGATRPHAHPSRTNATSAASSTTTAPVVAGHVVVSTLSFTLPRPSARAALVATSDGLVLLGGLDGSKNTVGAILRIDPRAGTVTPAGALAAAVHDTAGALIAGRPTIFGGGNATETGAVQAQGADGHVTVIGHLPIPRSDLATATVGDRTFIVGGYDGARVRATTISTADGVTFQVLGDLPTPVRYPAVAARGHDVFVVGGTTSGNASGAVRAIQALDTTTGAVRAAGTLPFALTDAVAATLHGTVYVIGGMVNGRPSNQVWRLDTDPAGAGSLTPVATLPVPLADAAVAVRGDTAYVVGGESPAMSSAIYTVEVR